MDDDTRDRLVAERIKAGECPFGWLKPGQTMAHCRLGFPGCGCGDEWMLNRYLQGWDGEKEAPAVTPGRGV